MGMFDYVICEVPLPDGWEIDDDAFQTKCFDSTMTTYKIGSDGALTVKRWDMAPTGRWFKWGPKLAREYVERPEEESINGPWEEMECVNERWEPVDFHGEFNFYANCNDDACVGQWHEYVAKYTDGTLVEIRSDPERTFRRSN